MALQGDLQSFALPDVLRLLAGTSKTGRLGVVGADRSGDVWLRDGQIVAGSVSSSRHATEAADVVFELLRFESGTFAFEDGEEPSEPGEAASVDDAIVRAEDLVREWHEVESVVPSVESWITFAPEIEGESTTVSAHHWRLLAAIGSGRTVREVAEQFEQTDLVASRQVKELVEAGLVALGDAPEDREHRPLVQDAPVRDEDDLSVLRADDGPVVLETSEDALLPEPLPGAGTSFEGDLADMGPVDGRTFEPTEAEFGAEPEPEQAFEPFVPETFDVGAPFAAREPEPAPDFEPFQSFEPDPAPAAVEAPPVDDGIQADGPEGQSGEQPSGFEPLEPAAADPFATDDPFASDSFGSDDFFGQPPGDGSSTEEVSDDPLDSTPSTDAASEEAVEGADSDRGALLNFLSTVKR